MTNVVHMGKNILIFSDGTGNASGLQLDEARTNVYKLYRATRCGPDSTIDPSLQVAFYDPGIGTRAADGWVKRFINTLCQMTGLGITRNIIDCYAAIIDLWEPEDRIYLFGFSRGAYTARCVGGVLRLCGVPRKGPAGEQLVSPKTIRAVATEAVKTVYQHGASKSQKRFEDQRNDLAEAFRNRYESDESQRSVPYFIGVWDTVAALGMSIPRMILANLIVLSLLIAILAGVAWTITWLVGEWLPQTLLEWAPRTLSYWTPLGSASFVPVFKMPLIVIILALVLSYLWTHVKWARQTRDRLYKTFHIVLWRLKFYDKRLSDRVSFARHAISVDESRKSFPRVEWNNAEGIHKRKKDEIIWFEQVWFLGNHGDVGGGYSENESRLSDIALKWIVDEASRIPYPILINEFYLKTFPSSAGVMHDECKGGAVPWLYGPRSMPNGVYLHPTVFERMMMKECRCYDTLEPYKPIQLSDTKKTFNKYTVATLNPDGSQPKTRTGK